MGFTDFTGQFFPVITMKSIAHTTKNIYGNLVSQWMSPSLQLGRLLRWFLVYSSTAVLHGLMFSRWKANAMSYTQISVVKNKWGLPYWIILSANYNFTCNKEIRWTGKSNKVSVGGPNQTQDTWLVQPVFCHWAMRTGQFSTFQHETRSKQTMYRHRWTVPH